MSILNQLEITTVGAGVVTSVGGNGYKAVAAGADAARLSRDFPAIPGVTYSCSYTARIVSGSGATVPFMAVDYPDGATPVDVQSLSNDFKEYTISFTVPFDADPTTEKVTFIWGIFGATSGDVEVSAINFTSDALESFWHDKFTGVPIYDSSEVLVTGGNMDVDVVRSGDVVTISAYLNITTSVDEGTINLGAGFLPTWALATRKASVFCGFSTGGDYFIAMDTRGSESFQLRPAFYKRDIIGGINSVNFGATEESFSLSYAAESVY